MSTVGYPFRQPDERAVAGAEMPPEEIQIVGGPQGGGLAGGVHVGFDLVDDEGEAEEDGALLAQQMANMLLSESDGQHE
jgi:hypothetical protein